MIAIAMMLVAGIAQPDPDVQILAGSCESAKALRSQMASSDGMDSFETRPCDKVFLTFLTKTHILVQFTRTSAPASQIIGFGGYMLNGTMMEIHTIYRRPGVKEVANGGHCLFSFRDPEMTGITCVGKLRGAPDQVELFSAAPGQ